MLKIYSPTPTTGLKLMVSFSRNNSYSAFKFVNVKGIMLLFQVLAETVLIPQMFDGFFNKKRHFKHTFFLTLASKIISLLF